MSYKEEKVIENGEEYVVTTLDEKYKFWRKNDQYHRLGGLPAVEYDNGSKLYYENGLSHRINGPAIEHISGYKEYCLFGKSYTEEEYYSIINNPDKLKNLINMEVIKEII